jgi:hypothetical protein
MKPTKAAPLSRRLGLLKSGVDFGAKWRCVD